MECPNCGSENRPAAQFCHKCGHRLQQPPTEPAVPAEVHIAGSVSGQVAIGNNILQIGDVHGGVVNVMAPGQTVRPKPRPTPIDLRPRPFQDLLDREPEIDAVTAALHTAATEGQTPQAIEFYAPAGMGKTSLLRRLAHHPAADAFPDGVVYLSARRQAVDDLRQALYDAFYESDIPFKPTEAQLKHDLQDKRALILLDDVAWTREEVETVLDAAPACACLLSSTERRLWGEGTSMALEGLPEEEALALIERELSRPIDPDEQPVAQALWRDTQGNPLRLIQVVAEAREEGRRLTEIDAHEEARSPYQAFDTLSDSQQRIIGALAALNGAPIHTEHLAALTGEANAQVALQALSQRGLAQAHSPRYTLTGGLEQGLQQAWDLEPWLERALDHFTAWAEEHRQAPQRLLDDADAMLAILAWAVKAGHWREVLRLGHALEASLSLGKRWAAWEQVLNWLHEAGHRLGDQAAEAWALHQLGTRDLCLGNADAARSALSEALELRQALGDRAGAAVTQHNLSLLAPPPATPPQEPPTTPKGRPPLPKWLLPAAGLVVGGGLVVAAGAAIVISQVLNTPPPPTPFVPPTVEVEDTAESTEPPATEIIVEAPWVTIELEEGCDRVYQYGDQTRLSVESNIEGLALIRLDGDTFDEAEIGPDRPWDSSWVFEDLSPGEHTFTVQLIDPTDEGTLDEASCPFTMLAPCVDFEDLPVRAYKETQTFESTDVVIAVEDGSVFIGREGIAGGSGQELGTERGYVRFDFGRTIQGLTLRYSQQVFETPTAYLEINGKPWDGSTLDQSDGQSIGGVQVSIADGFLQLDGTINSFIIGGTGLYIDDVCPQ